MRPFFVKRNLAEIENFAEFPCIKETPKICKSNAIDLKFDQGQYIDKRNVSWNVSSKSDLESWRRYLSKFRLKTRPARLKIMSKFKIFFQNAFPSEETMLTNKYQSSTYKDKKYYANNSHGWGSWLRYCSFTSEIKKSSKTGKNVRHYFVRNF